MLERTNNDNENDNNSENNSSNNNSEENENSDSGEQNRLKIYSSDDIPEFVFSVIKLGRRGFSHKNRILYIS